MSETIRAHVLLPRGLVEAVDRLVGQRRRSRFVEEAVAEKMAHEQQQRALRALRDAGGVLDPAAYPHWATPELTTEWVHELRREADEGAMRKIEGASDDAPA